MTAILEILQQWATAVARFIGTIPEWAMRLDRGSWPAAVVLALAGCVLLSAGLNFRRIVAAAGGAVLGAVLGAAIAARLASAHPGLVSYGLMVLLAVSCFFKPGSYAFLLGVAPGAILGARLPLGGRAWLGGLAGASLLGLTALFFRRLLLAATAAIGGTFLIALAVLILSKRMAMFAALARQPRVLLVSAAVMIVAGTAFQLGRASAGRHASKNARRPLDTV